MTAMHQGSFMNGSPRQVFAWDGSDEVGLVDFLGDFWTAQEVTVPPATSTFRDFDVNGTTLSFQRYTWSISSQLWNAKEVISFEIASGDFIFSGDPTAPNIEVASRQPRVVDGSGWWESDQYGRPLDAADLEA